MRAHSARADLSQSGQAAIELIGLLPAMVAVGLVLLQLLAVGYAMAGRRDDAERLVKEMRSPEHDRPVASYAIALTYVALRDDDRAMGWLETAFRDHDSSLTELAVDPMIDPIRSNPRFQSFAARVAERYQ